MLVSQSLIGARDYCEYEHKESDGRCDTVKVDLETVGLFKVPTLRNVGMGPREVGAIVAFMKTLTDR